MHIVNALRAHTRLNGARAMLLLNLEQKRKKALDGVGIDIVTIRPLNERFALQIQDRDDTRHNLVGRRGARCSAETDTLDHVVLSRGSHGRPCPQGVRGT